MPPFHANSPLSCLLGALTLLMLSQPLVADPRLAPDPEALYWQAAMARLEIPVIRSVGGRMRHFTEHCSATAITPGPTTLLLSAWHCFEDYAATQGPIRIIRATLDLTLRCPSASLSAAARCRRTGRFSLR